MVDGALAVQQIERLGVRKHRFKSWFYCCLTLDRSLSLPDSQLAQLANKVAGDHVRSLPAMKLSNTERDVPWHLHTSLIRYLGPPLPRARTQRWADHGLCSLVSERGLPACRPAGEDEMAHVGDATDLFALYSSPSPLPPCFFFFFKVFPKYLYCSTDSIELDGGEKLLNEQKDRLPQKLRLPRPGDPSSCRV